MKQFGKILNFELKYFFKNKIFVGVTIFLVALIAVVMFIPRISENFDNEEIVEDISERPIMLIHSETIEQSNLIKSFFDEAFPEYNVTVADKDIENIKAQITNQEVECAFVMSSPTEYTYYINNLSMYDMNIQIADTVLQNFYRMSAMMNSGMTAEEASDVMNIVIESNIESLGVDQTENFLYTYIMIFVLYMAILLYGQMVATNVATEKSSRAMELLITSAKPTSMMFGKVLASCIAGFIQIVAVFGSAILFYTLNKDYWGDNPLINSIFNMPIELFAFMLIFFVLGFLIYAFMFGAVGSTASKLEDINTSVMPITLLFVIGFVVVATGLTSGEVDNTLMTVCSYVPFTSSMAMFTRIAMNTVEWYEIVISISILISSCVGIGIIAAKIYRVGVLLYGNTPKIGTILKMITRSK